MADLSITAASVAPGTGATVSDGIAGATVTQGQVIYQDSTAANVWKLADTNASAAAAAAIGIALNGASSGQHLRIQTGGEITIGATVAVGRVYVLSATAGGICPSADLAAGHFTQILGIGKTTAIISLKLFTAGIAYA